MVCIEDRSPLVMMMERSLGIFTLAFTSATEYLTFHWAVLLIAYSCFFWNEMACLKLLFCTTIVQRVRVLRSAFCKTAGSHCQC